MSDKSDDLKVLAFDIETGPLSPEVIESIAPSFKAEDVKTGNTKDLKLISDKVEAARQNHYSRIHDRAALHAEYSQVVAIGITNGVDIWIEDMTSTDERWMLKWFWNHVQTAYHDGHFLAGHNIKGFDLPYLVRRSMIHRIAPPAELMPQRGRFWGRWWFDTMEAWMLGDRESRISLDRLSKAIQVGSKDVDLRDLHGKTGSGKYFAKLLKEDYDAAVVYLKTDLSLTFNIASHLLQSVRDTEIG